MKPLFVIGLLKSLDQASLLRKRRLVHSLRSRLGGPNGLGCTIEQFKTHLEAQFKPGMTWENYGCGEGKWCIDHYIPLASVKPTDKRQLSKVCHYSNLRPMWFVDNSSKGSKVPGRLPKRLPKLTLQEAPLRRFPKPLNVIVYEGSRRVLPPKDRSSEVLETALVSAVEARNK